MDLRPVFVSLIMLWSAVIIAPPVLWYAMQDDPVGITLNTGEEEPGETSGPYKWEEKIVCSSIIPGLSGIWTRKPIIPFAYARPADPFAQEVIVPPPEPSLL